MLITFEEKLGIVYDKRSPYIHYGTRDTIKYTGAQTERKRQGSRSNITSHEKKIRKRKGNIITRQNNIQIKKFNINVLRNEIVHPSVTKQKGMRRSHKKKASKQQEELKNNHPITEKGHI